MALMCRVRGASRSGYYASRVRIRPSEREPLDAEFMSNIREVHATSRETHGGPRVHAQLVRGGVNVSEARIARVMHAAGLAGRVRRCFTVTTDSKHDRPLAPNTLNSDFAAKSGDSVWWADNTYIPTVTDWGSGRDHRPEHEDGAALPRKLAELDQPP